MVQQPCTAAKVGFRVHPNMLRHAVGFKLANMATIRGPAGVGHKSISNTVR